jgi:hypothetical protein
MMNCNKREAASKKSMDFQGIGLVGRDIHRMRMDRLNTYPGPHREETTLEAVFGFAEKAKQGPKYYKFASFQRAEKPVYAHYQLRYMISSPVDSAVYFAVEDQVKSWNPITQEYSTILDMKESIKFPIQVTSIAASRKFVLAGGLHGELILKRLWTDDVHLIKLSGQLNSMTNHIECFQSRSGTEQCVLANNDEAIRTFDFNTQNVISVFRMPWAPNVGLIHLVHFIESKWPLVGCGGRFE